MTIHVGQSSALNVEASTFEFVERKGEGHPDTLSDIIADTYVLNYINDCWAKFPELKEAKRFPNLYVDKIMLAGAISTATFGSYDIVAPPEAILVGKVTTHIGMVDLGVETIFEKTVKDVFVSILKHEDSVRNLKFHYKNNNLGGADHGRGFYNPNSTEELLTILSKESVSNDSCIITAHYPYSLLEKMTVFAERMINGEEFKKTFSSTGTDVKVLSVRNGDQFDITSCVPFHPERTLSPEYYYSTVSDIHEFISAKMNDFLKANSHIRKHHINVSINTKDDGNQVYLAPWGTALSKGDSGVVGRGNKYNGFISVSRPSSVEAPAGKNPNHFAGKIYTFFAQELAKSIYREFGVGNQITISSRNGHLLDQPAFILIDCLRKPSARIQRQIEELAKMELKCIDDYRCKLLEIDPVARFRYE